MAQPKDIDCAIIICIRIEQVLDLDLNLNTAGIFELHQHCFRLLYMAGLLVTLYIECQYRILRSDRK